ncbi:MAG TPA: ABC transporter permease [Patescibacteria group bacterium]|nr:ABC transporter permease [Patescibacteria group bacterium]
MHHLRQHIPQCIISLFLLLLILLAHSVGLPVAALLSDALVRLGMNGVLTLAMLPMVRAGAGLNFGLPFGIIAGLLGMTLAVNFRFTGLYGFAGALLLSLPFAMLLGWLYARLLNRVRGREEIAGIFAGFSLIFVMNFFWSVAPFTNPAMLWPIGGQGLRPTVNLQPYFGKSLNKLLLVTGDGWQLPLGLLAAFFLLCAVVHCFFRLRLGRAMIAVGDNEDFARLAGVNIQRTRTVAIMLSTVLAALGICFYAQSYGFLELYDAPLLLAFPAASSLLLGGYAGAGGSVGQVVLGTLLFQTLYVFTGPLANELLAPQVSEILRSLITNSVILYSLFYEGRRRRAGK